MRLPRRALFGAAAMLAHGPASAQNFPSRAVTLMVPYVPGGLPDSNARYIAQRLAERLGQAVVVENRPGANGSIGSEAVARARPDGHTLLFGTMGTHGSNPSIYRSTPYDVLRDFTPVHALFADNNIAVVGTRSAFHSLDDIVAFARANPGKLNFGSGGVGSGVHLAGALFQKVAGIDITHVPYRGTPAALNDLVSGRLDLMFDYAVTSMPLIEARQLRPLAVTGQQRLSQLPQVPTVAEAGYPDAALDVWSGLLLPAAVPPAITDRLADAIEAILAEPDTIRWAARTDSRRMLGLSKDRFRDFIAAELIRWRGIVEFAGAQLD
ncbi:MAG TPA: tripartite tricarboxylate transporter substrate binding protein [Roseomonas sp.]